MKRLYDESIIKTSIKEKLISKFLFLPSDILLIITAAILCVIFVITPELNGTSVRVILSLLLILFIPGYLLIAVLYPKKNDLKVIERTTLSFALSIAVTFIISLLLNYTPFGIRLGSIIITLSVFIIFMSAVAYIRRLKLPEDEKFSVNFKYYFNRIVESFMRKSRTNKILSVVLVISIIIAVSATAYMIVVPKKVKNLQNFTF